MEDKDVFEQFFLKFRIYLLERRQDYLLAFKLNLLDTSLKDKLFDWIDDKLTLLDLPLDSEQKLNELKGVVAGHMKDLIERDGERTV